MMRTQIHKQIFIYTTPNELIKISKELKEKFNSTEAEKDVKVYGGESQTLIFVADFERIKNGE